MTKRRTTQQGQRGQQNTKAATTPKETVAPEVQVKEAEAPSTEEEVKVTAAPEVQVTVADVPSTEDVTPAPEVKDVNVAAPEKKEEGKATSAHVLAVREYVDVMAPGKPINEQTGLGQQLRLYGAIVGALTLEKDKDSLVAVREILDVIRDNRDGAFRDSHIFRFAGGVRTRFAGSSNFELVVGVMLELATPTNPKTPSTGKVNPDDLAHTLTTPHAQLIARRLQAASGR